MKATHRIVIAFKAERQSAGHDYTGSGPSALEREVRRESKSDRPYATISFKTMETRPLLIDGKWKKTGAFLNVRAPYSGEMIARVSNASVDEVEEAVAAAARASIEMRA